MIPIAATSKEIDRRVHRFCAPPFGNGLLLDSGHDTSVTSATATFVKFQSRFYVVTCHHVLSAFFSASVRNNRHIVPTLHSGRSIYQLGRYTRQGTYRWCFQSCRDFPDSADVDNEEALTALDRKTRNGRISQSRTLPKFGHSSKMNVMLRRSILIPGPNRNGRRYSRLGWHSAFPTRTSTRTKASWWRLCRGCRRA